MAVTERITTTMPLAVRVAPRNFAFSRRNSPAHVLILDDFPCEAVFMTSRVDRPSRLTVLHPANDDQSEQGDTAARAPTGQSAPHPHIAPLLGMQRGLNARQIQSGQPLSTRSSAAHPIGIRRPMGHMAPSERLAVGSHGLCAGRLSPGGTRKPWARGPDLILLAKSHPLYPAMSRFRNASEYHLTVVDTRAVSIRDKRSQTERVATWPVDEKGNVLRACDLAERIKADPRFSQRPSLIMSCPLDAEYLQSLAQHLGVEVRNPPRTVWVHRKTGRVGSGEHPPVERNMRLAPRPLVRVFSPREDWTDPTHEVLDRAVGRNSPGPLIRRQHYWHHLGSDPFPEQRQWYKKTNRGLKILVGSLSPADVDTAYPKRILNEIGPGMRVLDVGCGYGQFVRDLRARGINAIGVDPQDELPKAPYLINADLQNANFDNGSFDAILSAHSIFNYNESSEFRLAALRKMAELLKPGGKIYLGTVLGAQQLANFVDTGQIDSLKILAFTPENRLGNVTRVTGYVEFVKRDPNEPQRATPPVAAGTSGATGGRSVEMVRASLNGVVEQLSTAQSRCFHCGQYFDRLREAIYAGNALPAEPRGLVSYALREIEETTDANIPQLESVLQGSAHKPIADFEINAIKQAGLTANEARSDFSRICESYDRDSVEGDKKEIRDAALSALSSLEDKLRAIWAALDGAGQYFTTLATNL